VRAGGATLAEVREVVAEFEGEGENQP